MQKASSELISEDCLFLNVATPQNAIGAVTKLPVMFGSMEMLTRVEPRLSIQSTPVYPAHSTPWWPWPRTNA